MKNSGVGLRKVVAGRRSLDMSLSAGIASALRDPRAARRGRDGRGLPRARRASSTARSRSRSCPRPLAGDAERLARFQPRGAGAGVAEPSAHRGDLRARGVGRRRGAGAGARRGRDARRADRARDRFRSTRRSRSRARSPRRWRPRTRRGSSTGTSSPRTSSSTPDGQVKVLDFGLAKALPRERSSPDVTSSPTMTAAATQAGVVTRHGGLHVAGAGAREGGRQAGGHLGVRRRALRDARGPQGLRRRDGVGHARGGPDARSPTGARFRRTRRRRCGACSGAAWTVTRRRASTTSPTRALELDEPLACRRPARCRSRTRAPASRPGRGSPASFSRSRREPDGGGH